MSLETGLRPTERSELDELLLRLCRLPTTDLSSWLAAVAVVLRLDVIEVWSVPGGSATPARLARHVAGPRNIARRTSPATDVSALLTQRVLSYPRAGGGGLAAGIWRGEALVGVVRCERDAAPA